jgi:hypothetical protein
LANFPIKRNSTFLQNPHGNQTSQLTLIWFFEKAKYYTGNKLQFAIFQNGTVAFFANEIDNIEFGAKDLLDKIYYAHPDFNPIMMDDGNYLVEYSQPAFTIVFKNEIENHLDYIEKNHLDGICKDEVLLNNQGQPNVFDNIGKLCLFGRAKMFLDAQTPKVVRIFDPTQQ